MSGVSEGTNVEQSEVMRRLQDDHVHIAAVMDALEKALSPPPDGEVDWDAVGTILDYLQEYPDAVHHPLEDQMFDRVLDKGLTPAERELVHFNLAQHAEIISATQKLAADINNILNDIVVPIDQVQEHFKRYLELQRIHMRNENTHLFPLAVRLLSETDWSEIATEVASHADPMFDQQQTRFASLYQSITS